MKAFPYSLFVVQILLVLYCSALEITSKVKFANFDIANNQMKSCIDIGFHFFDASTYTCKRCPTGQVPDYTYVNGVGDAINCKCDVGYKKYTFSCAGVNTLECSSYNCTSCGLLSLAAYDDNSGMIHIHPTTAFYVSHLNHC